MKQNSSKKIQFILATVSTIFFMVGLYDSSPENIIPKDENIFLIIFYYIFILPIILWATLIWNRWLYDNMFEGVPSITYETFQNIATVVLVMLTIYLSIGVF